MTPARPYLPYGRQQISDADVAVVERVLRGDFLTTGPMVPSFESALASAVAAKHAVACSNGTAALHLAAMALDLDAGDAVIVPSITFLATANAPHLCGAEIEFADVAADSGLMTAETLAAARTRVSARGLRLRGVFPVHLNGQSVDMRAIAEQMSGAADVAIIEDACHALGGFDSDGNRVGGCRYSHAATFSFHPVKIMTTCEGGAITCNSEALGARLAALRNHGMSRDTDTFEPLGEGFDESGAPLPWYYEMTSPGFNYRLTDVACALGLSQLEQLAGFVDSRAALVSYYRQALSSLGPHIQPLAAPSDNNSAWHLAVALIDFRALGTTRTKVMQALHESGVGSQVHYIPVHRQPYYRNRNGETALPGADAYYSRCLSLPLFPAMTGDDVDHVIQALTKAVGR
jgi:UDP-4-amino-4,6-dideoxy-N-acetyl-beta-L-altrosamine transaminase